MNAALGHGVIEQRLFAIEAGDRPGVDDGRTVSEMRNGGACHMKIPVEICLQRLVEMILGQIGDVVGMDLGGRVVDEDIELFEFGDSPFDSVAAEGRLLHISFDHQAASAFFLDSGGGLRSVLILIKMDDRDVGTLAGEQSRHGFSNAAIATSDESNHVLQLGRVDIKRRVIHGRRHKCCLAAGLVLVSLRGGRLRLSPGAGLHGTRLR